jgi:hypothetical protein
MARYIGVQMTKTLYQHRAKADITLWVVTLHEYIEYGKFYVNSCPDNTSKLTAKYE